MKNIVTTNNAPKAIGPYSQAVEKNGILYISGQIPVIPNTGKVVDGGIVEQTDCVINNIKAILESAGYTIDDVVKTTCLLNDFNNFSAMNEIYEKYFHTSPPARVCYQVVKLPLDVKVEIEAIAMK
ncbi:MAG: RidA family protein [Prolixibacteraceae bacterium]